MGLITLNQLRDRLQWTDIREQPMPECGMRTFRVMPADTSLPPIDFVFHDDVSFLQQVGCGNWYWQPKSIEDAIAVARKLMQQELCVLEERTNDGKYTASALVAPAEIVDTISHNAGHFVRHFFGRTPTREEIDFSRYYRGKHICIEYLAKAEAEATAMAAGTPAPEW